MFHYDSNLKSVAYVQKKHTFRQVPYFDKDKLVK